eukprot:4895726-Pleurochrysis_carterae.AAC.1
MAKDRPLGAARPDNGRNRCSFDAWLVLRESPQTTTDWGDYRLEDKVDTGQLSNKETIGLGDKIARRSYLICWQLRLVAARSGTSSGHRPIDELAHAFSACFCVR